MLRAPWAGVRATLGALWLSVRPSHWVKNAFVLPPLVFSMRLLDPASWRRALIAVVAFCLASSAGYLVNDLWDRPTDRHNPRTARRPLATGTLPPSLAITTAVFLTVVALGLSKTVAILVPVGGYLAGSFLYSFVLKALPILDVVTLTTLYLLRLWGGSIAVGVPPSLWLLTCGGLLALVLSWGKRLAMPEPPYSVVVLRRGLSLLTALTVACFAAYTLAPTTREHFGLGMTLTLPWVVWALGRYRFLALAGRADPVGSFLSDWRLHLAAVLWGATVLLVVYLNLPRG